MRGIPGVHIAAGRSHAVLFLIDALMRVDVAGGMRKEEAPVARHHLGILVPRGMLRTELDAVVDKKDTALQVQDTPA